MKLRVNVRGRRVLDLAGPKPLYVSRRLENADDLAKWAKSVGLTPIDPGEMHVTVAYSRSPVDWFKAGRGYAPQQIYVPEGGPRQLDTFGKPGDEVTALRFQSYDLKARWDEFKRAGCSWDWPDYHPHVTVARGAADVDIKPFQGQLKFGPEEFEPIKTKARDVSVNVNGIDVTAGLDLDPGSVEFEIFLRKLREAGLEDLRDFFLERAVADS